jgi:hypothetical protein
MLVGVSRGFLAVRPRGGVIGAERGETQVEADGKVASRGTSWVAAEDAAAAETQGDANG